ncbi:Protein kinase domain [Dillenia turbinata]|uniref:Protein kinase domain n=1 Tax=Dillenia turbinata TaxID=194707 RepID=A0AAN8VGS2_9MAGN
MTCFSFFFGRKLDSSALHISEAEETLDLRNVKLYTYKELRIATEHFSPANKIGEGGYGSVYKGRLKGGQVVAVKVLSAESKQGAREFLTELNAIADVRHENLVRLYGCCVDENQRILVYSYLENNSLAQTLLGGGYSRIQFSWRTRSAICIGVARGLACLHEELRPHIVHRDIKASNILLDKDLTPKISDFGLAKLFPDNMTHISTRVAGTIGYLAPEYAIGGRLTRKADVYSFGVLLIEIVSGRWNTCTRLPVGEQFLLERTWVLYERKELAVLVDAALGGDFDAEEACRFLKIGLLCTQDSPKLRPSMSTVVKMLTCELPVNDDKITKPGLVSDFMDLKIRSGPKHDWKDTSCDLNSSGSKNVETLIRTSAASTSATITFTAASYDTIRSLSASLVALMLQFQIVLCDAYAPLTNLHNYSKPQVVPVDNVLAMFIVLGERGASLNHMNDLLMMDFGIGYLSIDYAKEINL